MPEILSLRSGPDSADGSTSESSIDVLYVKGGADVDASAIKQLEVAFSTGRVRAYANGKSAATAVLSNADSQTFRALVLSPGLNAADTNQLIGKVRDGGVTVAIVPVVTAADQGLRAIAAGADAVLLLMDGALVEPRETLLRLRDTLAPSTSTEERPAEPAPPPTVSAGRRMLAELKKLQSFLDMGRRPSSDSEADDEGRVRLRARLDDALDARVRLEGEADRRGRPTPWGEAESAPAPATAKPRAVSPFAQDGQPVFRMPSRERDESALSDEFDEPLGGDARALITQPPSPVTDSSSLMMPAADEPDSASESFIDPAATTTADTPDSDDTRGSLNDGRADLEALTRTLASEREAWATDRGFLEIRIADLEAAAGSKRAVEDALEDARAELSLYTEQHAVERTQWIAERNELLQRIEELASGSGPTSELESALESTRSRLELSAGQQAAERHEWETTRQALEHRISELEVAASAKRELEAALQVARTHFQAAADRQSTERANWAAERQRLEQRIGDLEVEAGNKQELEAALNATRAELEQVVKSQGAQRSRWAVERRQLQMETESRDSALQEALAGRQEAERALEAARAELQKLSSSHASAAASWESSRQRLESDLAASKAALDTAADSEAALQMTVDALKSEVRDAVEVYTIDKTAWESSRTEFEARIRGLEAEQSELQDRIRGLQLVVEERDQLREALERAEAETASLRSAHQSLSGNLGEARSALDRLAEEALSLRAKLER